MTKLPNLRFHCVALSLVCGMSTTTWAQDLELPPPAVTPATTEAGYLGMTADLLKADGKSVFVESVVDGGPAALGGLRANDILVEVNGRRVTGLEELGRLVRQPPGTKLVFKVRRSDVMQRFEVTVGTRPNSLDMPAQPIPDELPEPAVTPEEGTPVPGTAGGPPLIEGSRPQLGIGVADAARLSENDKRRLGVQVNSGAVISRITEGTPAARAGLPLGGVVVSVNGRRIGSAQDIVDLVRTFRVGQEVEVTYWEGDRLGRKKVRVGSSVVAVAPAGERPGRSSALRPRRSAAERPVLNALERLLDDVLPPPPVSRRRAAAEPPAGSEQPLVPPPPPGVVDPTMDIPEMELELPEPATAPAAEEPAATPTDADTKELELLRKQADDIQKQLQVIQQRINELEAKRAANSDKS